MTTLKPTGVNHLALSTTDMKRQLTFWCDVLGLPLKALYWMDGVKGALHAFVQLTPDSYVAFVQHPANAAQAPAQARPRHTPRVEVAQPQSSRRSTRSATSSRSIIIARPRAAASMTAGLWSDPSMTASSTW